MKHNDLSDGVAPQPSEDPIARNPKDVDDPEGAVQATEVSRMQEAQVSAPTPYGVSQSFRPPHMGLTGGSSVPLLRSMLRYKWTIVLVAMLVSAPIIAVIWTQVAPEYRARGIVRIRPDIPRLVFKTDENGQVPFYDSYRNTQVSEIRSQTVRSHVIDLPKVRETQWYNTPSQSLTDRLLGSPPAAAEERLLACLSVRPRPKTEIIDVSVTVASAEEAQTLLNAVLDEYEKYTRDAKNDLEDDIFAELREQKEALRNRITGFRENCEALSKKLGTTDPVKLIARLREDLSWTQSRVDDVRNTIALLEYELTTLKTRGQTRWLESDFDYPDIQNQVARIFQGLGADVHPAPNGSSEDNLDPDLAAQSPLQNTIVQLDQCCNKLEYLIRRARASQDKTVQIGSPGEPALPLDERNSAPDTEIDSNGWPIPARIVQLSRALGFSVPEERISDALTSNRQGRVSLGVLEKSLTRLRWDRQRLREWLPQYLAAQSSEMSESPENYEDEEWRALDRDVRALEHQIGNDVYAEKHPQRIQAERNLEFAKELRAEREKQLDEMWEKSKDHLASNGSGGLSSVPVADTTGGYHSALQSLEYQIDRSKRREELLLLEVKRKSDEFDKTYETAMALEKDLFSLAQEREMYDSVRTRFDQKEMERNDAIPGIIEVRRNVFASSKPSKDRRIVFAAMALIAGVGLGGGAALLRAVRNQTLYTSADMPGIIQAPFLGHIPFICTSESDKEKVLPERIEQDLAALTQSVRMMRTEILLRLSDNERSSVLITSAQEGTGKSTFSLMLAESLARTGKKILLIDADPYKMSLSDRSGILGDAGFVESLKEKRIREEDLKPTDTDGLSILPAGNPRRDAEFEDIANGAFRKMLTQLYDVHHYDIIVLDCPPVLPKADASILANQVDGAIMVERENVSHRADVVRAVARLGSSGACLLGSVFVGSSARKRSYGYGYGDSYGYAATDN